MWNRYLPTADQPWNLRRVVHLHRRAGFAATWSEIQRDLKDGPDLAIARSAIETVLRREAFFSEANIGNRVRGPTEFIVGTARALEMFDPPPSTWLLAEWTAILGQDLFNPPNVFGWPGGRS